MCFQTLFDYPNLLRYRFLSVVRTLHDIGSGALQCFVGAGLYSVKVRSEEDIPPTLAEEARVR